VTALPEGRLEGRTPHTAVVRAERFHDRRHTSQSSADDLLDLQLPGHGPPCGCQFRTGRPLGGKSDQPSRCGSMRACRRASCRAFDPGSVRADRLMSAAGAAGTSTAGYHPRYPDHWFIGPQLVRAWSTTPSGAGASRRRLTTDHRIVAGRAATRMPTTSAPCDADGLRNRCDEAEEPSASELRFRSSEAVSHVAGDGFEPT